MAFTVLATAPAEGVRGGAPVGAVLGARGVPEPLPAAEPFEGDCGKTVVAAGSFGAASLRWEQALTPTPMNIDMDMTQRV